VKLCHKRKLTIALSRVEKVEKGIPTSRLGYSEE